MTNYSMFYCLYSHTSLPINFFLPTNNKKIKLKIKLLSFFMKRIWPPLEWDTININEYELFWENQTTTIGIYLFYIAAFFSTIILTIKEYTSSSSFVIIIRCSLLIPIIIHMYIILQKKYSIYLPSLSITTSFISSVIIIYSSLVSGKFFLFFSSFFLFPLSFLLFPSFLSSFLILLTLSSFLSSFLTYFFLLSYTSLFLY